MLGNLYRAHNHLIWINPFSDLATASRYDVLDVGKRWTGIGIPQSSMTAGANQSLNMRTVSADQTQYLQLARSLQRRVSLRRVRSSFE